MSLMRDIRSSPLLARTGGMYSYGWRNLDLNQARLREHLARGQVVGLPGDDAWAIVVPHEGEGAWLAHVEGAGEEVERLAAAIVVSPQAATHGVIRALLPPDAPGIAALRRAGFGEPEDPMRVYELRLTNDQRPKTKD
jgi:hypothetical protein